MPDHVDLPIGSARVLRAAELAARGGLKLALMPDPRSNMDRTAENYLRTLEAIKRLDVEIIPADAVPFWRNRVGREGIAVVVVPAQSTDLSDHPARVVLTPLPRLTCEIAPFDKAAEELLRRACERMMLGVRASLPIITIARTAAGCAGSETVKAEHVAEALSYRDPIVRVAAAA